MITKIKTLAKELKKAHPELSHGHCLELISRQLGFKNWNTASAVIRKCGTTLALDVTGTTDAKLENFRLNRSTTEVLNVQKTPPHLPEKIPETLYAHRQKNK